MIVRKKFNLEQKVRMYHWYMSCKRGGRMQFTALCFDLTPNAVGQAIWRFRQRPDFVALVTGKKKAA